MQDWLKGLYERSPNLVTRSFPAGNPKNDQGPSTSKRAKLHTDSTELNVHAPFYAKINEVLGLATDEFYTDYVNNPLLKEVVVYS